jgi:hypothetical protein
VGVSELQAYLYDEGFDALSNFYYDEVFFIESPIKLEDRNLDNICGLTNVIHDKTWENVVFKPPVYAGKS